jgi:hypothetical protein
MDRDTFTKHLLLATDAILPFIRGMVSNDLPDSCRYLVALSHNYFHSLNEKRSPHLGQAFQRPVEGFPQHASEQGLVRSLSAADVGELLCVNGEVPEWNNVEVHSADGEHTYLKLECCGRLTSRDTDLYHGEEGYPPFHVLSGYLPLGWESVKKNGRFDLRETRR